MADSDALHDPDKKHGIVAQFLPAMPYAKALKMRVDHAAAGEMEIAMPYSENLIGDPETGVIHGGAVFALMDTCSGGAVMAHPKASIITATLDLRIDYMRPATPGEEIVAKATCYHVTKTVAFTRAVAYDNDTNRPVATATGAFTVETKQ